jgi:hypothetical protein
MQFTYDTFLTNKCHNEYISLESLVAYKEFQMDTPYDLFDICYKILWALSHVNAELTFQRLAVSPSG